MSSKFKRRPVIAQRETTIGELFGLTPNGAEGPSKTARATFTDEPYTLFRLESPSEENARAVYEKAKPYFRRAVLSVSEGEHDSVLDQKGGGCPENRLVESFYITEKLLDLLVEVRRFANGEIDSLGEVEGYFTVYFSQGHRTGKRLDVHRVDYAGANALSDAVKCYLDEREQCRCTELVMHRTQTTPHFFEGMPLLSRKGGIIHGQHVQDMWDRMIFEKRLQHAVV